VWNALKWLELGPMGWTFVKHGDKHIDFVIGRNSPCGDQGKE